MPCKSKATAPTSHKCKTFFVNDDNVNDFLNHNHRIMLYLSEKNTEKVADYMVVSQKLCS